ncbi:hypothetical protein HOLleu_32037 [Holothuria leucospilota]|uniref:Uncharacterized protein n=1 Tax=Holothuria leucospilota TaxID=206669 RepID=A0A9Q0YQW4_HOLLE|nr:hypothetical protein HOLleu_32037 [Holothuria leucospilota]
MLCNHLLSKCKRVNFTLRRLPTVTTLCFEWNSTLPGVVIHSFGVNYHSQQSEIFTRRKSGHCRQSSKSEIHSFTFREFTFEANDIVRRVFRIHGDLDW